VLFNNELESLSTHGINFNKRSETKLEDINARQERIENAILHTENQKLQAKFDHEWTELEEEKQTIINNTVDQDTIIKKTEEILENIKLMFQNPVQLWRNSDNDRRRMLFRVRS